MKLIYALLESKAHLSLKRIFRFYFNKKKKEKNSEVFLKIILSTFYL